MLLGYVVQMLPGASAGAFDIMIAAHAEALGATLVTNDVAVKNLRIDGLKIVSW